MRKFANVKKMVELSMPSWRAAHAVELTGIRTLGYEGNKLVTTDGHQFINMISCSYLGLNRHPKVVQGAVDAILREGTMSTSASRARIAPVLMDEVESLIGRIFDCQAIVTVSCTAASATVLPLLASGHLTGGDRPLMVFDKNCHFSMNVQKAVCADETEIVTCPHNDIEFLENACRNNATVAYIADGAYSMGGNAPVTELLRLQKKYGLFLYFDDSHSISVYGVRGEGYVRSQISELGDRTIIVGSLAKAFGATGGIILFGNPGLRELFDYCGGPLGWSQMINAAGLGAIKASAEIHLSKELGVLQARLKSMMNYFDEVIPTENAGNGLPIRVINLDCVDSAVTTAASLFKKGFYTSAVFFPIVSKEKAGLRAMGRADMTHEEIKLFCVALKSSIS